MRAIPERPARMFAHAAPTPIPTGETIPSPVTTTRRVMRLERMDTMGFAVRDRDSATPVAGGGAACSSGTGPLLELSALLLHVCADEIDCLFDRRDLLRFFVGNLGLKLLLEGHHELDG